MQNYNIQDPIYVNDIEEVGKFMAIQATIDGIQMSIPLDPANRHYAEIMRQVEAGTLTIADAQEATND